MSRLGRSPTKPSNYPIQQFEACVAGQFIDRFEDRPLGTRCPYGPTPNIHGPSAFVGQGVGIFDTHRIIAEQRGSMRDDLFRYRQTLEPGRRVAVKVNAPRSSQAQIVDRTGKIQCAFPAQMHLAAL